MKNVKAIIFDAYGTLFDVNSAAEKCKDKIGDKWEEFANYWRTTQLEYSWLRSLMDKHKDFWQVTEDSLEDINESIDVAVIGCVVNGPGEAKEASVGVTGGSPNLMYINGKANSKVDNHSLVETLEANIRKRISISSV